MLTGRYRLEPSFLGGIKLVVEDCGGRAGYTWRMATRDDLPNLEPVVADGWRFPEERSGILFPDGKRIKED